MPPESDRLPPAPPPGDATGERAPSLLSEATDEFALRAARLTLSARLTVVLATARRRVRRAAAVEGIPATRPPPDTFEGYTSTTPKNERSRNRATQEAWARTRASQLLTADWQENSRTKRLNGKKPATVSGK